MENSARWSWIAVLACVALTPLATSVTSMTLRSLPLTYDAYVIPKLAALGLLSALALALWAADVNASSHLRWHPAGFALVGFAILAALSTALALDSAVALFGRDAANGLLAYLCYVGIACLIVVHVTGTTRLLVLSRTVVASGVVTSSVSLFQAAVMTPERIDTLGLAHVGYLYGRGGGLLGNPDFVGAFLVAPLVLALALVVAERPTANRVLGGAASALIGGALIVSQVRGAWLAAILGIILLGGLLVPYGPKTRRPLAIAAISLAFALVLGLIVERPTLLLERVRFGMGYGLDAISSGRLSGWRDALAVLAARPITGTGPDSFTLGWYRQASALADSFTGAQSYFEDPHNVFLTVGATMGLTTLVAFLVFVAIALAAGVSNIRRSSTQEALPLYAGWLAAFAGLLATAFVGVATIPLVLLIFVAAAALIAPSARNVPVRPGILTGLRVLAVSVAVLCLAGTTLPIRADYHLGQYMRTRQLRSLESARTGAPWEKTIQLQYLEYKRASLVPLLQQGGSPAIAAVNQYDTEAFALASAHPYELLYTLERIEVLQQAASVLDSEIAEKALTVVNLAVLDYPELTDLRISQARALNNLGRYTDAARALEALPPSVRRDVALAEAYVLSEDEAAARETIGRIQSEYIGSQFAESFLAQPAIVPYVTR